MKARVKETKEQNITTPTEENKHSCTESNAVPEQTETTAEAAKGVQRDVPFAPESLTYRGRRYFWSTLRFSGVVRKKYEGTHTLPREHHQSLVLQQRGNDNREGDTDGIQAGNSVNEAEQCGVYQ